MDCRIDSPRIARRTSHGEPFEYSVRTYFVGLNPAYTSMHRVGKRELEDCKGMIGYAHASIGGAIQNLRMPSPG
jgi:hypothetical protein